ncbi:MAG: hypothetical protein NTW84_04640 [Methanothrix sp.]|nr:hypothetical protein [Methanothrix sp.]
MLNTSAVVAFWPGFESGSRRDQADTLVIGSSEEGAVDSAPPPPETRLYCFWVVLIFKLLALVFVSRKPHIDE